MRQQYGIGLEAEGFILDAHGKPVSRIDGSPASAWVLQQLKKSHAQLVLQVGLELASVFLEVKTGVHTTREAAVTEVVAIRRVLNQILEKKGAQLVFVPVSSQEFEFVPSSEEPNSRVVELVERWGKTAEGRENLIASSVASLQINDSRPFHGVEGESDLLEKARQIHNLCKRALPKYRALLTTSQRDFRGKTRTRNYRDLVERVEADKFKKYGYKSCDAVIPPYFADTLAMQVWMCAYSDVSDFKSTNPKDEHALTCKIKRGDPWIVEVRYPDAVDTEEEMLRVISVVEGVLAQV